jgi:hypothetical protein
VRRLRGLERGEVEVLRGIENEQVTAESTCYCKVKTWWSGISREITGHGWRSKSTMAQKAGVNEGRYPSQIASTSQQKGNDTFFQVNCIQLDVMLLIHSIS